MAKKIEIFHIDAFTSVPFYGNPAAVCFADGLEEIEMMQIANEMNLAETAFLSRSERADYDLRWFSPTVEVELCGHATIASLHFLKEHNLLYDNSEITLSTMSGILKCGMKNGKYYMQIPVFGMEDFIGNKEEICEALGLSDIEITNLPFILMENTNLYIQFDSLDQLQSLNPDFNYLKEIILSEQEFGGIAAFTLETIEEKNSAHLRYFAPAHGINEDTVTGSANGPLLLVLKYLGLIKDQTETNLTFEQGDFKGRPGRVNVSYSKTSKELYISGDAVTVLKGELLF